MYNYGTSCGCMNYQGPIPYQSGNNSNFAIILVLFILLVIIIGTRYNNN